LPYPARPPAISRSPCAQALHDASPSLSVWPLPANASNSAAPSLPIDPYNFTIFTGGSAFLDAAAARYYPLILFLPQRLSPAPGTATFSALHLVVTDPSVTQIQQGTDESYALKFAADGTSATVTAATVFGALRGLETFSELVSGDKWEGSYRVSAIDVTDAPRFSYRGLLVDAARHWLPPALLLNIM
jgi:hexosaminidase